MSDDKNTIGVTDANRVVMDRVVEKAGFGRDMDAAKFALALAISRGCEPSVVKKAGTIWNIGTFDENGELKALVENLFPGVDGPYRAVESLIDLGFGLLAGDLAASPNLSVEALLKREAAGANGTLSANQVSDVEK